MANIGNILRDEIARLSRRELRKQVTSLQKTAAGQRRDIAAMKKQIATLERATKAWSKRLQKTLSTSEVAESNIPLRFRADGLRSLRTKLGLSAEQAGQLLGVSGQSIYAWETKRSTPRRSQLPAIAALRKIGKREALARLEALSKTPSKHK